MSTLTDGVVAAVTCETFSVMLGWDLFPVPPGGSSAAGATSLVHISGISECSVQLTFSPRLGVQVAAAMFDMDESDIDDESLADALGELANVIGGGVKSMLPAPSQLSLPTVALDPADSVAPEGAWPEAFAFSDGGEELTVTLWRPVAAPPQMDHTASKEDVK